MTRIPLLTLRWPHAWGCPLDRVAGVQCRSGNIFSDVFLAFWDFCHKSNEQSLWGCTSTAHRCLPQSGNTSRLHGLCVSTDWLTVRVSVRVRFQGCDWKDVRGLSSWEILANMLAGIFRGSPAAGGVLLHPIHKWDSKAYFFCLVCFCKEFCKTGVARWCVVPCMRGSSCQVSFTEVIITWLSKQCLET